MESFKYASRIKQHKVTEFNTEEIKPRLRERYRSISKRLSQFDQWEGGISPEQYWGQFVDYSGKRFFLRSYQPYCKSKADARRLADCLNKCDSRIIFDGLLTSSEKFGIELQSYLSGFLVNSLLNFFFQNYNFFLSNSSIVGVWNTLLQSDSEALNESRSKDLLIKHIGDIISSNGHNELLNLLQIYDESNLVNFVKGHISSSSHFLDSNFLHVTVIQFSDQILSSPQTSQNEIEDYIDSLLSLNNKSILLVGLSACILKIKKDFSNHDELKTNISEIARIHIGSPRNEGLWGSSISAYMKRVELARIELMKWQNEKVAIQFFEAMNFDKDRKQFWLSNIRVMDEVKISISKAHIMDNYRLKQLFEENSDSFILLDKSSTSCILMKQKDSLFIEFSKHGNALYVYRAASDIFKLFNRARILNSGILKDGYPYKKVIHRSGWQSMVRSLLRSSR